MARANVRQFFQRWNCARLSAPISHTKRRRGKRRTSCATVSTVKRVPSSRSIALTRIGARLKAEQLRILLALLVLAVCGKLGYDLLATPGDLYNIAHGGQP